MATDGTREWFYQVKTSDIKTRFRSRLKVSLIETNERGNPAGFGRYFDEQHIDVFCFQFPQSKYSLQVLYKPMSKVWEVRDKYMTRKEKGLNVWYEISVNGLLKLLKPSSYSEMIVK